MWNRIIFLGAILIVMFTMYRIFTEDARLKYEIEVEDEMKNN